MNLVRKPIKWLFAVLAGSLIFLLILLVAGIRIDLTPWREPLLNTVNSALPYHLEIAGDLEVEVSLRPAIWVTEASIKPQDQSQEALAKIGQIKGQLSLLPLLRGKIDVDHFLVEEVDLSLFRDSDGKANWEVPGSGGVIAPEVSENPEASPGVYDFDLRKQIVFRNLAVRYQDQSQNLTLTASLAQLIAGLKGKDNLNLVASGDFQGQPWNLESNTSLKALLKGQPSTITGEVSVASLNLSPWLEGTEGERTADEPGASAAMEEAGSEAKTATEDENRQTTPVHQLVSQWLNKADVDVRVNVKQVTGLPVTMENLGLEVSVSKGKLVIPMAVDLGGVNFQGRAVTTSKKKGMEARVSLQARKADIGELVTGISGAPAAGHVERAGITVRTSGRRIKHLINEASLNLMLEQGQLAFESELPWKVNTAEARIGLRQRTEIQLDAELLTIPVNLALDAEPLIRLRSGKPWKVALKVDSPAFTASADGFVSERSVTEGSEFNFNFSADRFGDLAPWLGIRKDVDAPLILNGQLIAEQGVFRLSLPEFRAGQSRGYVRFSWDGSGEQPFADFYGRLKQLHLDEMSGFWPEPAGDEQQVPTASGKEESGLNLNVPLLSREVTIADADLIFAIDSVIVGGQEIKAIQMKGGVRDGWLQQAPFSAEFAGARFYGDMALDLRSQKLGLNFNLGVDRPDFGRMLSELNFADGLNLSLDKAQLNLSLKGETPLELFQKASLEARLTGGVWTLHDSNSGASMDIVLSSGVISAQPDKPVSLDIAGELKELPVSIKASTLPLNSLLGKKRQVPLTLTAAIADMSLKAHSQVTLPIEQRTMELDVEVAGPSLSQLDHLFEMSLPPYEPLRMAGHLSTTAAGYELNDFQFQVGDSSLKGYVSLDTRSKPDLKVHLQAPSIQVNDFQLGDWQAWNQISEPQNVNRQEVAESETDSQPALLSPEILGALDAEFKLDVDEVLSGKDQLGKGQLYLQLADSEVRLNPLYVALPGGEVSISGHLKPFKEKFSIGLKADVDRFDYGVVARRVDPETPMQGDVSFRLNIETEALTPDDLFSYAQGQMAFAVWPREFEAGIIDLWAVSLASAVLPKLGPQDPSQVNCMVGSFNLEHGQMADNVLMLDTSAMQVLGNTQVDFVQQKINLVLVPRAKTAQIFGLELPVQVSGSFTDFGVGVPSSELVATSLKFVTSPVLAPMRWILEQSLPSDGSQMCETIFLQGAKASGAN